MATHTRRAFTLIELMVATLVISVLMLAIYHAFSSGLLSWNRVDGELGTLQEGRNFMANLTGELGSAATPLTRQSLAATPTRLTFFTGYSLGDRSIAPAMSTTMVTYDLLQPPETPGMLAIRRTRQFYAGSEPISQPASAVVLLGARKFDLAYLSPDSTVDRVVWVNAWSSSQPPRAVRITLVLEVPAGPSRPPRMMQMSQIVPLPVPPPAATQPAAGGTAGPPTGIVPVPGGRQTP